MKVRLILIRHGLTKWNLEKRYAGFTDLPLSSRGLSQARRLKRRFKGKLVDKIYVSDRKRAIQTARIIFSRRRVKRVAGLREINFGILEGLTYQEILNKHPLIYSRWLKNPFTVAIPRGERLADFKKRVVNAFNSIISLHPQLTVAVVCHGGVISIFLNHLMNSKDFWKNIPKAGSVTVIEYNRQRARVVLFNDLSHI